MSCTFFVRPNFHNNWQYNRTPGMGHINLHLDKFINLNRPPGADLYETIWSLSLIIIHQTNYIFPKLHPITKPNHFPNAKPLITCPQPYDNQNWPRLTTPRPGSNNNQPTGEKLKLADPSSTRAPPILHCPEPGD